MKAMRWHPKGYGGERRDPEQVKRDGWKERGISRLPPLKFPTRAEVAPILMSRPASEIFREAASGLVWARQHGTGSGKTS